MNTYIFKKNEKKLNYVYIYLTYNVNDAYSVNVYEDNLIAYVLHEKLNSSFRYQ